MTQGLKNNGEFSGKVFKSGDIPWNKGIHMWQDRHHPKGTLGKKLPPASEDRKRKISQALKDRPKSEEHKQKLSGYRKGKYGGEKHWNWKDGRYSPKYRVLYLEKLAGRPKPKICEVCSQKSNRICFDHDHKTSRFRGWICHQCNVILGLAKDNPIILRKLSNYLEKMEQEVIHF